MTLHGLKRGLQGFNIRHVVVEVIQATADKIVELNQEQLAQGKLKTGEAIYNLKTGKTNYGAWWGEFRDKLGLQTDHYDFRVTGDFYNSIEVSKIDEDVFTIDSNGATPADKYENLISLFGPDFLGLTDESKSFYIANVFFPRLQDAIEQRTPLRFRMV